MQQRHKRAGAEDLTLAHQVKHRRQRHPFDPARFLDIGRFTDQLRPMSQIQLVRTVHHADHRLERQQVGHCLGPPSGLFLDLTSRRSRTILALVHDAARQLPAPLISHEPMPPQHQHPISIIDNRRDRHPLQPDHVMLETPTARRLHIDLDQSHPRVLIQRPLPEHAPARTTTESPADA